MLKRKISLILNWLIVIFEIIGLIVTLKFNHRISFEYYTEDSNILTLLSSTLFILFLLKNKEIPKWLQKFKYITTICLSITFFVVIFILAPMYNFNYEYLLFNNSLLYQHLLCPILSMITFIFFDSLDELNIKDNLMGLSFTIIYAIILVLLNILEIVEGPYPFLMVRKQPLLASIIWFVVILSFAYFVALILRKIRNMR